MVELSLLCLLNYTFEYYSHLIVLINYAHSRILMIVLAFIKYVRYRYFNSCHISFVFKVYFATTKLHQIIYCIYVY